MPGEVRVFGMDELDSARAWVTASWECAHPWGSGRVYPNFPDLALDDDLAPDEGRILRLLFLGGPQPADPPRPPQPAHRRDRMRSAD